MIKISSMKHIKLFENHNMEKDLAKYGIIFYTINPDGSIDVNGDVNLNSKKLGKIIITNLTCQIKLYLFIYLKLLVHFFLCTF